MCRVNVTVIEYHRNKYAGLITNESRLRLREVREIGEIYIFNV